MYDLSSLACSERRMDIGENEFFEMNWEMGRFVADSGDWRGLCG
jgi:hypothetical protein